GSRVAGCSERAGVKPKEKSPVAPMVPIPNVITPRKSMTEVGLILRMNMSLSFLIVLDASAPGLVFGDVVKRFSALLLSGYPSVLDFDHAIRKRNGPWIVRHGENCTVFIFGK